jgi:hypothetical protein
MDKYFLIVGLGLSICTGCNTLENEHPKSAVAKSSQAPTDTTKMIRTQDIKDRIHSDFGENAIGATKILEEAISKYEYLNHDRIIRCIIYLSERKLDKLKKSINQAIDDPRDVMLWAEYINLGEKETPRRVRDFNKTFQNCEKDVQE